MERHIGIWNEEKEDEKPANNEPKRRVQPAAPAVEEGRRTAAPKYNVVSTNK